MRRQKLLQVVTAGLASVFASTASVASAVAPDLSGFVPDFSKPIPFLVQGRSATVNGTLVTATTNTGVDGGSNRYLHQSKSRLRTVLTFGQPIPGFQVQTQSHSDCPDTDCFEDYTLVGFDSVGSEVFRTSIRNDDGTFSYVPGTGAGDLTGPIATLEIDYTHDTPVVDFARGSFLTLRLTDTYLSPAEQTIIGPPGQAIEESVAYVATGFSGSVSYQVTTGTLPAGLVLDEETGVISGVPTEPASTTVTITATGATTGSATATVSFAIDPTATTTAPATTVPPDSTAPTSSLPQTGGSASLLALGAAALATGALFRRLTRRAASH